VKCSVLSRAYISVLWDVVIWEAVTWKLQRKFRLRRDEQMS
jgi:hypothetical protein